MINNIIILIFFLVRFMQMSEGIQRNLNTASAWVGCLNTVDHKWWTYDDPQYSTSTSRWWAPNDLIIDWNNDYREWSSEPLDDARIPQRHFCPFDAGVCGFRSSLILPSNPTSDLGAPIIPISIQWEYYFSYGTNEDSDNKYVKSIEILIGIRILYLSFKG